MYVFSHQKIYSVISRIEIGVNILAYLMEVNTVFPQFEHARSINFILVLRGDIFKGVLSSRAHSNPPPAVNSIEVSPFNTTILSWPANGQ